MNGVVICEEKEKIKKKKKNSYAKNKLKFSRDLKSLRKKNL